MTTQIHCPYCREVTYLARRVNLVDCWYCNAVFAPAREATPATSSQRRSARLEEPSPPRDWTTTISAALVTAWALGITAATVWQLQLFAWR